MDLLLVAVPMTNPDKPNIYQGTNMPMRFIAVLMVASSLLSATPSPGFAQGSRANAIAVQVVLSEGRNDDHAIITRHAADGYVITLGRSASSATLNASIRKVHQMLAHDGNELRDGSTTVVKSDQRSASESMLLTSLRQGRRRSTFIYLPNTTTRTNIAKKGPSD